MANPFAGWSNEQVAAHNARVTKSSTKGGEGKCDATVAKSGREQLMTNAVLSTATRISEPGRAHPVTNTRQIDFTSRPNTDEQKLNKTERAYLWHLRKLNVPKLRIQQFTLKLADDCRLTADFTYVNANGRMVFVDVKGFQREDALIKMKMAARQFDEFDFVIVKRNGAWWEETPVNP